MRFAVVTAMLPMAEIPALAVACGELGYDAVTVADHVVDPAAARG